MLLIFEKQDITNALAHKDLTEKLENKYDQQFADIYEALHLPARQRQKKLNRMNINASGINN